MVGMRSLTLVVVVCACGGGGGGPDGSVGDDAADAPGADATAPDAATLIECPPTQAWTELPLFANPSGGVPSIRFTADGTLHMTYLHFSGLRYARRDPAGTWIMETAFATTDATFADLRLGANTVHVVFGHQGSNDTELLYTVRDATGTWSAPTMVAEVRNDTPNLVLDTAGIPHVVYDTDTTIFHAVPAVPGPGWAAEQIVAPSGMPQQPQIDRGATDQLEVCFAKVGAMGCASRPVGGAWTAGLEVPNEPGTTAGLPAIAVDPGGGVHHAWGTLRVGDDLVKVRYQDPTGAVTDVDSHLAQVLTGAAQPEIAVTSTGVHLAYGFRTEALAAVRHAYRPLAGGAWTIETVACAGVFLDLAVDPAGVPHIAFGGPELTVLHP